MARMFTGLPGMCSVFALLGAFASPAFAQTALQPDASAQGDESLIPTIIVTAQKREENLQRVPVAVSVVTADDLLKSGVSDTQSLRELTPGLNVSQTGPRILPFVRGVGTGAFAVGNESNVALYVDGAYVPSASADVFHFSDIERIEVLKGPQGTLFGRNATGGLISIVTRNPDASKTRADFVASYSRFNEVELKAYLSAPITDTLAGSVSAYYDKSDGYLTNPNFPGKNQAPIRNFAARGKLRWEAGGSSSFVLSADYSKNSDVSSQAPTVISNSPLARFAGPAPNMISSRPRQATPSFDPTNRLEQYGGSLNADIDLGNVALVSVTAFRHTDFLLKADSDATPFSVQNLDIPNKVTSYSEDIRLESRDSSSPFTWTIGAFGFLSEAKDRLTVYIGSPALPAYTPLAPTLQVRDAVKTKAYALYAQGSYELDDHWSLTAGLRYSYERKKEDDVSLFAFMAGTYFPVPGRGPIDAKAHWDDLSPKLVLQYTFSPQTNVYASYSKGFKSGTFNPYQIIPPAPISETSRPVRPEKLDAYEIGLKTDIGANFRTNIAAYYYEYKGIQEQVVACNNTCSILVNAARSRSYGFDADLFATFPDLLSSGDKLSLRGGVAYLNAKYKDYSDPLATSFRVNASGLLEQYSADATGLRPPKSPKWTENIGIDYSHSLDWGTIALSANLYFNSGFFSDPLNTPAFAQDSYEKVNVALSWTSPEETLTASVWGKNITGSDTYQTFTGGLGLFRSYDPPATYGVSLGFHF